MKEAFEVYGLLNIGFKININDLPAKLIDLIFWIVNEEQDKTKREVGNG